MRKSARITRRSACRYRFAPRSVVRHLELESLESRRLLAATDFRFVTYNALNYGTNSVDRQDDFQTVFDDLGADIVVMQEITSEVGADLLLGALNASGGQYARANFINGNDSDHILFYDTTTVDLISQNYLPTTLREFGEYTVRVAGTEFNIYSVHLKASTGSINEQRRLDEVTILRNHLATLSVDTEFIVAGDMNIYGASEPAYQKMVGSESDNAGRLEDLLASSLIGEWHDDATFAAVHSQSPRTTSFGGGARGGLDDRFDMILGNSGINDGVGVEYVTNSYFVHGNDGQHFNQSIITGTNTAVTPVVAQALHNASDHLPVVADFQIITAANAPGVTLFEFDGSTDVAEGGPTDSYTIVLDSVPTDDVIVDVIPNGQLDLGNGGGTPVTVSFTPTNSRIPQTIVVSSIDDLVNEGAHTGFIQHTLTSLDINYNGMLTSDVNVNITDNDTPVAEALTLTATKDGGPVNGNFLVTGVDTTDTHTFAIITQPANGTVNNHLDGTFTFDPGTDFQDLGPGETRNVIFQYTATDDSGTANATSAAATVTVTVMGSMPIEPCDINRDGTCDAEDIDAITQQVIDGSATPEQRRALIENPAPRGFHTYLGDSNLDGRFDEQDLVAVFIVGKYLTGQPAGWADGDWNGYQIFDQEDFVDAFIAGSYLAAPRSAVGGDLSHLNIAASEIVHSASIERSIPRFTIAFLDRSFADDSESFKAPLDHLPQVTNEDVNAHFRFYEATRSAAPTPQSIETKTKAGTKTRTSDPSERLIAIESLLQESAEDGV